jgi:hypothetical protein
MTGKLEQKLNELMRNWTNGNRSDAERQLRALKKRHLAHLLINQHRLDDGVSARDRVGTVKFQDWIVGVLDA